MRALRAVGEAAPIAGHREGVLASMPAPLNVVHGTRFGCVPEFRSARRRVAPCVKTAQSKAQPTIFEGALAALRAKGSTTISEQNGC